MRAVFTTLASAAFAATWSSEPQAVQYDDQAQVFTTVQFDTGFWPSPTDPIAIRFYLTPIGGIGTSLPGTSRVEWPELAHHVESAGPGEITMDAGLEIGAEISLDLFGIYSGIVPLVTQSVDFVDRVEVDGLLLPGGPADSVTLGDDMGGFPPLEYGLSVIPGVELVAAVDFLPTVAATVTGREIVSEVGEQQLRQTTADGWVPLSPDPLRPGELGLITSWDSQVDAQLSLVLEPHVDVDTFLGTFTLVSFPIPVDLVDSSERRTSTADFAIHPLPVLQPDSESHDFGVVAVGSLSAWELPLQNLGDLVLQGAAWIEGDPAFAVWPDGLAAVPQGEDGLSVTFHPTAPGEHTAELWLETNDPYEPVIRIALTGAAGWDEGPNGDPGSYDGEPQKFCGCASLGGPVAGVWALLPLLLLRRRRG